MKTREKYIPNAIGSAKGGFHHIRVNASISGIAPKRRNGRRRPQRERVRSEMYPMTGSLR